MSNLLHGVAILRPLELPPDIARQRVVDEKAAAQFCGVSPITMERMRKSECGPRFVRLSERRLGYRVGDLCDWLESRLNDVAVA
jgi:hypothetical protein